MVLLNRTAAEPPAVTNVSPSAAYRGEAVRLEGHGLRVPARRELGRRAGGGDGRRPGVDRDAGAGRCERRPVARGDGGRLRRERGGLHRT
jgi:hypothetical protein